MSIAELKKAAAAAAKTAAVDMSQESTGGGGAVKWPDGVYRGRLTEVIEFGRQPQEYQGQKKAPANEVRIGVTLFPTKRVKDELGADVEPKQVRSRNLTISNHTRAGAKAVFDKLNVGGTYTTFAEALGDAFKFKLVTKTSKQGREYQTIDWAMTQPAVDDETGQALAVPDIAEDGYVLFLFDYPSKAMWDKLYIEGKNDAGKSKNFIQEQILSALNFPGSALEALLKGGGKGAALPDPAALAAPEPALDESGDEGFDLPVPPPTAEDEY